MAKTVLCFGDSNTFGLKPNPFPWTRERWPERLSALTGCDVISEGLLGRTASTVNRDARYLDALPIVPAVMESHAPVDIVIVMLGTNDLQARFGLSPENIAISLAAVIKAIKKADRPLGAIEPELLLIAPPLIEELGFRRATFAGASEKSKFLGPIYKQMAQELGVHFLDASEFATVSRVDGIHLDPDQHHAIAHAISVKLNTFGR